MQASIFLPKRKVNGKSVIGKTWRGRIKWGTEGNTKEISLGTPFEQVARDKLALIVHEMEQEAQGNLAPRLEREALARPLSEHIKEFIKTRESLGNDARYIRQEGKKLERLCREVPWNHIKDISHATFEQWRILQTVSPKTLNEYLITGNVFCNWLVKLKRIPSNPLGSIEKVNESKYEKRTRRAVTWPQLEALIASSGDRGVTYLTAAFTGLRRGELAKLTWKHLQIDTDTPSIVAPASITKNGKRAPIPLNPLLADSLRRLKTAHSQPSDLVFAGLLPRIPRYIKDLEAVGIPYVDESGKYFDFHALRTTFCTLLATSGASIREAMEMMRHSDARLTTQIYTDVGHLPLRDVANKLGDAKNHLPRNLPRTPTNSPDFVEKSLTWDDLDKMNPEDYESSGSLYKSGSEALALLGRCLPWVVRDTGFEPVTPTMSR